MEQSECIKSKLRSKPFTLQERKILANLNDTAYKKSKHKSRYKPNFKEFAQVLGRSVRGIRNEYTRGMFPRKRSDLTEYTMYSPYKAQDDADAKKKNKKGRPAKVCPWMNSLIDLLQDRHSHIQFSIYAAIQLLKKDNPQINISLKTIYNKLHNGELGNLTPKKVLFWIRKRKKVKKQTTPYDAGIKKGHGIDLRPEIIDLRLDVGHWEGDTVVSKRGDKTVFFSFIERFSRFQVIYKASRCTKRCCKKAIKHLLAQGIPVKSITFDNGREFSGVKSIEKQLQAVDPKAKIYFAHPYCSCERASNENNHRLIRHAFPKKTRLGYATQQEIKELTIHINNYPRALFNGKSASQILMQALKPSAA